LTRPSHTTVVAYLALFLALGAGTAFAANQLAKNSVGPKQLKKNAVTGAKIKKDAVTGAKVKDGSLLGSDLADGTITGPKVADGSLSQSDFGGTVKANNVTGVAVNADCTAALPFPSGVSATPLGVGGCRVEFPSNVLNCVATATVAIRGTGLMILAERTVQAIRSPVNPNSIALETFNAGASNDLPVDLTLVC
jgi:hypothetical protein